MTFEIEASAARDVAGVEEVAAGVDVAGVEDKLLALLLLENATGDRFRIFRK